jgi:hypothetical protein
MAAKIVMAIGPHSVNPCDHKLVLSVRQIVEVGILKDRYFGNDANNHRLSAA